MIEREQDGILYFQFESFGTNGRIQFSPFDTVHISEKLGLIGE